jgi:DNA-binding NtrC family response regulator
VERVATKEFREDLYYRLNVIHVVMPPLRERREDIWPLFAHFLGIFAKQHGLALPEVAPDAVQQLEAYAWPGNVRELKNLAERLIVRGAGGATVTASDLPIETSLRRSTAAGPKSGVRESPAELLFQRMVRGRESFWTAVYPAFMARDLTRDDIRELVGRGLAEAHGNYKIVIELFNIPPDDYKRFLNFLKKHNCHMPFHGFRTAAVRVARQKEDDDAFARSAAGGL